MIGESAENYHRVVIDFGDGCRVVECRAGIQWIVQRRLRNTSHPWEGQYFCRTKKALLVYAAHPQHPALLTLPDHFPAKRPESLRERGDSVLQDCA